MGKISQNASKYIIHASLKIEGTVDKPDIIGAVFGQTEGLLGNDLELRELQRNGRIGRIEVNSTSNGGKTEGEILIPSSLDKAETCIIGAAMEIIQRIGPCNSHIKITSIEDIRASKRDQVVGRAKDLLRELIDSVMPDSQEIAEEVAHSVRVMEITNIGKDKLSAGPNVEDSEEILIVEGRADVLNLLKHGFKNAVAINGTSIPKSIVDIAKGKTVTVFVDGDRGGDLIIRELSNIIEIDFVTKAPDGKEVEEITKKEINKAIRSKIPYEQAKIDLKPVTASKKPTYSKDSKREDRRTNRSENRSKKEFVKSSTRPVRKPTLNNSDKEQFKIMSEEMIGTHAATILDNESNVLGKVPSSELESTIKSLKSGIKAIIVDGEVTDSLVEVAEKARVKFVIGSEIKAKNNSRINLISISDL